MQLYYKKSRIAKSLTESAILLGMLLSFAFYYYRDIFHFWFVSDDAAAIVSSLASFKDIFFSRIYSSFFYTPLVAITFKPDVQLFGMNPYPYHVHNTVILTLIAFMTYKIVKLYTDRISALVPAIIVLLATPSLICLLWITLRQYLYAMFLALLSIYLFLKYNPSPQSKPFIVLVILLLAELSFMGKEQFMSLPFVLFILCEGSFKQRIFKTYPYFILVTAHFFLRLFVLGGIGGYIGFRYDPVVYFKTIIYSVPTQSKILFGCTWFFVVIMLPFLLRKANRLFLLLLLWVSSLSISFLVMFPFPQADTYRYWLISTVLFAFLIGFNISYINNIALRLSYCFIIMILFFLHSFTVNIDLKKFASKESLMAKKVTEVMLDKTFEDSLILFPDSSWLANSNYITHMSEAYKRVNKMTISPPFIPLELLAFYPEIKKDFKDIFELRGDAVLNINDSIEERTMLITDALLTEKPQVSLSSKQGNVEIEIACGSSVQGITAFSIRNHDKKFHAIKYIAPYSPRINLTNALRIRNAEIMPRDKLLYSNRQWYLEGRKMHQDHDLLMIMCQDNEGKHTLPSDVLLLQR